MASDLFEDDNPIEEILLSGFPNPERVGCPPHDVIEALGSGKIGREHEAWQHVWNCSPCFKDFKTLRDARWAQERKQELRRTALQRWAWVSGLLACVVLIGALFWPTRRSVALVNVSLVDAPTFRGSDSNSNSILATLPRKVDELHIKMKPTTVSGGYVIAVLPSTTEKTAIAIGSGITRGLKGHLELVVVLDLSAAASGRYYLATREQGQGTNDDTYYYPVLVSD